MHGTDPAPHVENGQSLHALGPQRVEQQTSRLVGPLPPVPLQVLGGLLVVERRIVAPTFTATHASRLGVLLVCGRPQRTARRRRRGTARERRRCRQRAPRRSTTRWSFPPSLRGTVSTAHSSQAMLTPRLAFTTRTT